MLRGGEINKIGNELLRIVKRSVPLLCTANRKFSRREVDITSCYELDTEELRHGTTLQKQ